MSGADMRADGKQNRQRLLEAATELFAERGTSVNVAEIVAAAGVAAPTLYRHFGDKDGLIKAIDERTSEASMARLAHALTRPTGWEGLRVAMLDSIELARTNRGIRERNGITITPALERLLISGWEQLVGRGQAEGSVREDLSAVDVPVLFTAAAAAAAAVSFDPALSERYVAILLDGIRPTEAPLPAQPPTLDEVRRAHS